MSFWAQAVLLFFFYPPAQAQFTSKLAKSEKSTVSGGKVIEWRETQKGPVILQQTFDSKGRLVTETESNGVEKIVREFDSAKRTTHIEFYLRGQKIKSEDWEVILVENEQMRQITTRNFSSGKESISYSIVPLLEPAKDGEPCTPKPQSIRSIQKIAELKPFFSKFGLKDTSGTYYNTTIGIKFDEACFKMYGPSISSIVQNSFTKSLACLHELKGKGSQQNLAKMVSILTNKTNQLKINCSATKMNWNNYAAAATTPGDEEHPAIFLNPEKKYPENKLSSTLFHEILHNCGHVHTAAHIEYMYACQQCCFEKKTKYESERKEIGINNACKVCKGNYSGPTDPKYLKDLIMWSRNTFSPIARNAMIENTFGKTAMTMEMKTFLIKSMADPIGCETIYNEFYNRNNKELVLNEPKVYNIGNPTPELQKAAAAYVNAVNQIGNDSLVIASLKAGLEALPPAKAESKATNLFNLEQGTLRETYEVTLWTLYTKNRYSQGPAKALAEQAWTLFNLAKKKNEAPENKSR